MDYDDKPLLRELKSDLEKGKLSRREFVRYAALIGVSAAVAMQLGGCEKKPEEQAVTDLVTTF